MILKTCFYTVLVFSLFISSAYASSDVDTITGGRLYDEWWVNTDLATPSGTHPAYPASGKKKGAATWRCKECHGWDYHGKDGAYQKGSHFTGIKGISGQAGKKIKDIIPVLTDERHQYGAKLPEIALQALATFVSQGQMDINQYIDGVSKKVNGNSAKGKTIFADTCQRCHGEKGNAFNLTHKKGETETIGSISNRNPWKVLHKIRFGNPGAVKNLGKWVAMPPTFEELSESEQVDLLSYLQTLPK